MMMIIFIFLVCQAFLKKKKKKIKARYVYLFLMLNLKDPDITTSPNFKSPNSKSLVVLLIDVCKIVLVNI